MIDQLFESILGSVKERPKHKMTKASDTQILYGAIKEILGYQGGLFLVASVLNDLEERKIKHTHQEVIELLHLFEDVGKVRKMGEVQVGDISHNLYHYEDK
jgi:hypothetical protein